MYIETEEKQLELLNKFKGISVTDTNLVPDIQNPSCDYFTTSQVQLYAAGGGVLKNKMILNNENIFRKKRPNGWAYFYGKARSDLLFVTGNFLSSYSKINLNSSAETLKKLSDKITSIGWKGIGCFMASKNEVWKETFATTLENVKNANFSYLKIDINDTDASNKLVELKNKIAPQMILETGISDDNYLKADDFLGSLSNKTDEDFNVDIFKSPEMPACLSIPLTMRRLKKLTSLNINFRNSNGIINCGNETYIAAAGGFTMGITRHPFVGEYPNGVDDSFFAENHRNLKTKMYEVLRAVNWHKVAPAFFTESDNIVTDFYELQDTWNVSEQGCRPKNIGFKTGEYADFVKDNCLHISAPARIAICTELARVFPNEERNMPFVISSRNPNGVFSVATLGRTINNQYSLPKCDVVLDIGKSKTVGVFGEYKHLILNVDTAPKQVLMQDLADGLAFDITAAVSISEKMMIIPGELIHEIGTLQQPEKDSSEPAVVVKLIL